MAKIFCVCVRVDLRYIKIMMIITVVTKSCATKTSPILTDLSIFFALLYLLIIGIGIGIVYVLRISGIFVHP